MIFVITLVRHFGWFGCQHFRSDTDVSRIFWEEEVHIIMGWSHQRRVREGIPGLPPQPAGKPSFWSRIALYSLCPLCRPLTGEKQWRVEREFASLRPKAWRQLYDSVNDLSSRGKVTGLDWIHQTFNWISIMYYVLAIELTNWFIKFTNIPTEYSKLRT